jgi:NADH-quinone oxidoreductase subunit L
MTDLLWIVIALPLAGAAILLLFGRRIGAPMAGWVASGLVIGAFVYALGATVTFLQGTGEPTTVHLFDWLPVIDVPAELLWDPLAALMTLIVTGVGAVIHVYAIGYMHDDERFPRFFAYLNLFIASMLVLVLAANYGIMFVGWELVGLCSYLLISFWFVKPSAAAAGKKAFIVNRIGDWGFLVALMVIFFFFGTLDFATVFEEAPAELSTAAATVVTLLLFIGATGKSAQIPLYIWLPDAMEGPTPVSALIHAATMVTAGVYMIARSAVLFDLAPTTGAIVATIGMLTAVWAAVTALGQRDIKRVLAYSTISQLGYMVFAVGIGAYVAGMFHLTTHAVFKALLFLGAGSVIHAMDGEQDMWRMGGLRHKMPVTFWTMVLAWLAIIGAFPLSGFWSKDEILASAFAENIWLLWGIGILTVLLTAFYMTRLMFLTFLGSPRWRDGVVPHESPAVMAGALIVLAIPTVVIGGINTPFRFFLEHFLEPAFEAVVQPHPPEGLALWLLAALSLAMVIAGVVFGWSRYRVDEPIEESGTYWRAAERGFYVDDVYGRGIVLPLKAVANWLAFPVDQRGIDGAVDGVAHGVRSLGEQLRPVQNGLMRSYALGIAGGALGLVIWLLISGGAF